MNLEITNDEELRFEKARLQRLQDAMKKWRGSKGDVSLEMAALFASAAEEVAADLVAEISKYENSISGGDGREAVVPGGSR